MPSLAIPGYKAQVFISPDGVSYNRIAELTEVTLTVESNQIDVTSHDNNGWSDTINGIKKWSATAAYLYVDSNAEQSSLFDAIVNETTLYFRFLPKALSGMHKWEGQGVITTWKYTGANADAAHVTSDIHGRADLTKLVQP